MNLKSSVFLLLIIAGCSQGGSGGGNMSSATNPPDSTQTAPGGSPTVPTSPQNEELKLASGATLVINHQIRVAQIVPVPSSYKLQIRLVNANWGFLPDPKDLDGSCKMMRAAVKDTLVNGLPANKSPYSDFFDMSLSAFGVKLDYSVQYKEAQGVLDQRGLAYNIQVSIPAIKSFKIESLSTILAGRHPSRNGDQLLTVINSMIRFGSSPELSTGEVCDLIAGQSVFYDSNSNAIRFSF